MTVAFVADLESGRNAAHGRRAKYVEAFDENAQIDAYANAFLFNRVLLKQIGVNKGDALHWLGILAADLEAVLERTKYGRL